MMLPRQLKSRSPIRIETDVEFDLCDQMGEMDEGADRAVQSIRGQGPGIPVKITMMNQNNPLVFQHRQSSSSFNGAQSISSSILSIMNKLASPTNLLVQPNHTVKLQKP